MVRIVVLKDTKPLAIGKNEIGDDTVWICRCGLSAKWPICDGSHKKARKEEPGKLYAYTRTVPEGKLVRQEVTPDEAPRADPRPEGMEVA